VAFLTYESFAPIRAIRVKSPESLRSHHEDVPSDASRVRRSLTIERGNRIAEQQERRAIHI
jgi:hypothetical protein